MLRITEVLNRLSHHLTAWLEGRAGRVRAAGAPPLGCLPRDAFLSSKLGPKLNQQLKDVLSICGGERTWRFFVGCGDAPGWLRGEIELWACLASAAGQMQLHGPSR